MSEPHDTSATMLRRERESPGLVARRDRYGLLAARVWNLTVLLLVSSAVNLALSLLLLQLWSGYEIRTGFFAADELGELVPLGRAESIDRRDPRVVAGVLKHFARSMLTRSVDPSVQRSFVEEAESLTMGQARQRVQAYLRERNPFTARYGGSTAEVERREIAVLPVGAEGAWQISCEVRVREEGRVRRQRVILIVTLSFDGDERVLEERRNAFGVWIATLNLETQDMEEESDEG